MTEFQSVIMLVMSFVLGAFAGCYKFKSDFLRAWAGVGIGVLNCLTWSVYGFALHPKLTLGVVVGSMPFEIILLSVNATLSLCGEFTADCVCKRCRFSLRTLIIVYLLVAISVGLLVSALKPS